MQSGLGAAPSTEAEEQCMGQRPWGAGASWGRRGRWGREHLVNLISRQPTMECHLEV